MKNVFFVFFFLLSMPISMAQFQDNYEKTLLKVAYFKNLYGHIHQNPSRYSTSLTTISCGHPVKIYKLKEKKGKELVVFADDWHYVKVGPYEGYLRINDLLDKKPDCFQDRYTKFVESLNLEVSDMFYWGKLYDQYLYGKSKAK